MLVSVPHLGLEGFEPSSAGIFLSLFFGDFETRLFIILRVWSQRSKSFFFWSPLGCQVTPQPLVVEVLI